MHRYLYAGANPTRFVDPTGQSWEDVKYVGTSLGGFGQGVVVGTGKLVVGTLAGTAKLAITGAKLQSGIPALQVQAAHELGEMGTALWEGATDQARLLRQATRDPSQVLEAAAEIGPERYGQVIGGATVETASAATVFAGVGAARAVARGAAAVRAEATAAEAVVVQEGRVAAATATSERAAIRAAVSDAGAETTAHTAAAIAPRPLPRVAGALQAAEELAGPTSAAHPGRLAAESSQITQQSVMRALRQSDTAEGAATAKLIKRGRVTLEFVDDLGEGVGGLQPYGSHRLLVSPGVAQTPHGAAGYTAHEARHFLQRLKPTSYGRIHELDPYRWQAKVDPGFATEFLRAYRASDYESAMRSHLRQRYTIPWRGKDVRLPSPNPYLPD